MISQFKMALTGAHGTGKTTLAHALKVRLGPTASVTPEVPRLIIEEVNEPAFFRRGNNTFARQCLILARQLEVEGRPPDARILICDRSMVDHWAYTRYLFPDAAASPEGVLWESITLRWMRTYDLLIHVPPEFAPQDDGVRENDQRFQRDIDHIICELHKAADSRLLTVRGALSERVDACLAAMRPVLQSPSLVQ